MKINMPILNAYKVTWHDKTHNYACFDEDDFYTIEELIDYLKYSKESIENNYDDIVKVWVKIGQDWIELVNIERVKDDK